MKVLGLVSSPRKGGNGQTLVENVLAGVAENGAETELIRLTDVELKPCLDCGFCKKEGNTTCVQKDAMADIYAKLAEADAVIFGMPIYFGRPNAPFLGFIDRMYAMANPDFSAYDLLQALSEASDEGRLSPDPVFEQFVSTYGERSASVTPAFDADALNRELDALMEPLKDALNEARFEAASAASLHEFAKEVFDIWQTSGIFARRRALRELRGRAGFRLESHRIGNYVAKTFDLMNEAQARFARAQQALFAADVRYKIIPDIYSRINDVLSDINN